jgi:hypothetical protein
MEEDAVPKYCHLAIELIDNTTSFLRKSLKFHKKFESGYSLDQLHHDLTELVEIYTKVDITISLIKSISRLVENPEQKHSMMNAANSAANSTFDALLKIYDGVSPSPLGQQSRNILDTQIYPLLSKNDKFEATKYPPTSSTNASTQFLNAFERIVNAFASGHHLSVDDVWEDMFSYAVNENYKDWVVDNLFKKNLTWEAARYFYIQKYPDVFTPISSETTEMADINKQNNGVHCQQQHEQQTTKLPKQAVLPQEQPHTISKFPKMQHQRQTLGQRQNEDNRFQQSFQNAVRLREQDSLQLQQDKNGKLQFKLHKRRMRKQYRQKLRQQGLGLKQSEQKPNVPQKTTKGGLIKQPNVLSSMQTIPKRIVKDSAWYAETLFHMKMKADEDIGSYNATFLRNCRLAHMETTDRGLIRRYVNSLSEAHQSKVRDVIARSEVPIYDLNDAMVVVIKEAIENLDY